ncbi:hypothetical protein [Streptomyces sp. NPDC017260]|uniref:hypothetical protein n=1 Tax=unclassified Streptomyces TaxID=2593676 RepID=UPI00379C1006
MTLTHSFAAGALPGGVPSARLSGRYIAADGTPLAGTLSFAPPSVLTLPNSDVIAATAAKVTLDSAGCFVVDLIPNDVPGMSPQKWAYQVTEKLKGLPPRIFHIMLPSGTGPVDLADIAPVSPYAGNYLPVAGPKGDTGATGAPGEVTSEQLDALEARVAPRPQEFVQTSASTEWTIPHTMPYRPFVTVYDTAGHEIGGLVEYPNPAVVLVRFAYAETGTAVLH